MEEKIRLAPGRYVCDIEGNGLLDEITKIHCIGWIETSTEKVCSTSYIEQIKDIFQQDDITLIMHYGIMFDKPAIEKVLGIKVKCKIWDSLAISWVISSFRDKHGLEEYGEEFGIPKPVIKDWDNLPISEYIRRVEEDCKINFQLWKKQAQFLNILYGGNHEEIERFLDYLSFKMECVSEHQKLGVRLDIDLCKESLAELETIKEEKIVKLKESMPKRAIKAYKFPPKIMYKKDGSPSENRIKWLLFLKEQGLSETHNEEVEFTHSYEDPNPNSHDQIKNWLFSLGWVPQTFNYIREEGKSEMRKVPQIKDKEENDGSLCESVLKLVEKEPALEALDSLYVISHRINVLKGFLRDNKNGRLYQDIRGLTNTLRLQHGVIVNLPNAKKAYAGNVRKCLIADEGKIMVGCDLKGIEDNTKRHYIYPLDPEYVKEQMVEGFDGHLDIAVLAGMLTKEQADQHKLYEKTKGKEGVSYKDERYEAKQVNFSAIYGVGVDTLSRNSGMSKKKCKELLETFWSRNWAIKKVAETFKVKEVNGQKFVFNPISRFWYSLRAEKDRFSTVNQSSAVYVFDTFLKYLKLKGITINFQIHDEFTSNLYENYKESYTNKILESMKEVNEELKLNIPIECSIDFGKDYISVH